MIVYNAEVFLAANADLVPVAGIGKGWTLWTQKGNLVLEQKLMGISMYYPTYVEQQINISRPTFLDGPMSRINDNLFEAMICLTPS